LPCIYIRLVSNPVNPRFLGLGILGNSLRNIIPFVGSRLQSEVGSREGFERKPDREMQNSPGFQSGLILHP